MSYQQRDIVLIPVPFTDLSTNKRRPVLVISSTTHNATSPDILVAAITSNIQSPFGGVLIDTPDMESGAMPRVSIIRPDKLYSLSDTLVVSHIGQLGESKFVEFLAALDTVLGR